MPTFRNISGLGDLEINGVGLVEAGATFEVPDELAEALSRQADNFEVIASDPITAAAPVDTVPAEEN